MHSERQVAEETNRCAKRLRELALKRFEMDMHYGLSAP